MRHVHHLVDRAAVMKEIKGKHSFQKKKKKGQTQKERKLMEEGIRATNRREKEMIE